MLQNLNLNHVTTFLAVAEASSFKAAAEQIHISQSAVSVRIKLLEARLGVPLFHRTTRSVKLTNEGQRLFAVAKDVFADMMRVAAELRDEASLQSGVVTIAATPTLAATVMPAAMAEFGKLHPGITLRLIDVDSGRALEMIVRGDADMGLLSEMMQQRNVDFAPLFWDECFVVVRKGHPLSVRKKISVVDTMSFPLLLSPRGTMLREATDEAFHRAGLRPEAAQESWSTLTLLRLAEAGLGVALITRMSMSGLNASKCRVLRLRERVGRTIGIVRALNRSESPSAAAFRGFLLRKGKALAGAEPR
jgi:LysR family transcriptional regulator, carnitine catabolism transcriptional activator